MERREAGGPLLYPRVVSRSVHVRQQLIDVAERAEVVWSHRAEVEAGAEVGGRESSAVQARPDVRQSPLPIAGHERLRAPRRHDPRAIAVERACRQYLEQRRAEERHVGGDGQDAVGRRRRERSGQGAEDTDAPVAEHRNAEIRETVGVVGHDEDLVGYPPQLFNLSYDDGASPDDQPALVATAEPAGASAGDDGRGWRGAAHVRIMPDESTGCRGDHRVKLVALVALVAVLGLGGAGRAWAQPVDAASGTRVLVMPFAADVDADAPGGAGMALWLGEAAALLVTDSLSALGVGVIDRDERVAAFDSLQVPMKAVLTRATMLRVAQLIGASDVVFGELVLGSDLTVRARMVRLESAVETATATGSAPMVDLFGLFRGVATDLTRSSDIPTGPPGPALDPLPVDVFENYVKGLVAATPAARRRFLELAMADAPRDPRILQELWAVYTADGEYEQALAVANAVPPESAAWTRARFAVALSLVELGRFDGAFRELTELNAGHPSAAVSNALGVLELRRDVDGGASAAASYFEQAARRGPGQNLFLFNLGYAYARAGQPDAALHWLRESLRYDAADGDARLVMSLVLASTGRAVEARRERELAELLGTDVSSTATGEIPAGLERIAGTLDGPVSTLAETAIADPAIRDQQDAAAYHLDRGRRLVNSEQYREAIDELRRAVYLLPDADEPHLLLGHAYQRTGRLAEAIDEFIVALWCRETAAGRLALAAALLEDGDAPEARVESLRALALDEAVAGGRELLDRIDQALQTP